MCYMQVLLKNFFFFLQGLLLQLLQVSAKMHTTALLSIFLHMVLKQICISSKNNKSTRKSPCIPRFV